MWMPGEARRSYASSYTSVVCRVVRGVISVIESESDPLRKSTADGVCESDARFSVCARAV